MRAAIPQYGCAGSVLVVILLFGVSDIPAGPHDHIKLNQNALPFAEELINESRVVADGKGAWSEHRPSPDKQNEFIRLNGFGEYAKWHLGLDDRYPQNTKRRYKFPYGDFQSVHRCGLLAVKARAHQYGYVEIEKAAAELERMMKNSALPSR
jgi:hypothetical protein